MVVCLEGILTISKKIRPTFIIDINCARKNNLQTTTDRRCTYYYVVISQIYDFQFSLLPNNRVQGFPAVRLKKETDTHILGSMTGENKIMDISELNKLTESISKELECTGFEVKPFKVMPRTKLKKNI